jgi:hypothetical protein
LLRGLKLFLATLDRFPNRATFNRFQILLSHWLFLRSRFKLRDGFTTRYHLPINRCGPREPKIANSDGAVLIQENIGRLNIPVHYTGGVHEIHGAEDVVKDMHNLAHA